MTEQSDGSGSKLAAPYFPWPALLTLVQRMATEGPPTRIDKSYLEKQSGGMQTAILSGLRWLGLIGDDGRLTDTFIHLAEADEAERKEAIADLLRSRYVPIIELGAQNTTQLELEDAFKTEFGAQGETRRKAVAFYLKAAAYAGIPVSRNWKPPRSTVVRSARRKAGQKRTGGEEAAPSTNSQPRGDLRRRYVEMLMAKAEAKDDPDEGLLNRIEAALNDLEPTT
jgi:Family of unknown function (DUF5343)